MNLTRSKKIFLWNYIVIAFTALLFFISSGVKAYATDFKNLNEELLKAANYIVVQDLNDISVSKAYAAETLITTNISELQNSVIEQKKLMSALKNKESSLLNPYPILTARNTLGKAYSTSDMGTMYFAGTNVHLYYSSAQSVIDAKNSAAVLGPEFGSDPIGIPGGCSIIGDHNFQTGKYFGNLKIGSKIYIKTPYGQFLYQVTKTNHGYTTGTEIYTNDGIGMVATAKSKGINGIILYTCYPFNSANTSRRYLVFAKLIAGTTLS